MESVLKKRENVKENINVRKLLKPEKEKKKTILNKLIIQLGFCIIISIVLFTYKIINPLSFEYNKEKYSWILKYNMEYTNIYNYCANYLNNTFQFKIPLKEDNVNNIINNNINLNMKIDEQQQQVNIEADANIQNNNQEELITNIVVENEEIIINEMESYNSMKIMADEIKKKYNFIKPTTGQITCPFGNRQSDNKDISTFHLGIDIGNVKGTEIFASIDGIVSDVSENSVYGKHIKINTDNILIVYAHCNKTLVKKGDKVKAGELIAQMGDTGLATGVHLHFEVRENGAVINPEYLIDFN